jgi:hypothetical protein
MNAMIASNNTIFCIERLKKLLNRPSLDALALALLELPNADEPVFFELERKSMLLLQNQRIKESKNQRIRYINSSDIISIHYTTTLFSVYSLNHI